MTSATAERTFLNTDDHVLLLHIHKECADALDLFAIAKEFVLANYRCRSYFWTILVFLMAL